MAVMPVSPNRGNTIALSPPPAAMIVPDGSSGKPPWWRSPSGGIHDPFGVYVDNWTFAQQWSNWPMVAVPPLSQKRTVVTVPLTQNPPPGAQPIPTRLQPFLTAIQSAAQAAQGGDVVFFVGHGSTAGGTHLQTSFDLLPEMGGFDSHQLKMTAEVLDLQTRLASSSGTGITPMLIGADALLNDKLTVMKQAATALQVAHVRTFIILSCAVGTSSAAPGALPSGPDFVKGIAKLLGVPVVGYTGFVATRAIVGTGPPGREQLHAWVSPTPESLGLSGEPAATTDTTRPEFHEVPMPTGLMVQRGP